MNNYKSIQSPWFRTLCLLAMMLMLCNCASYSSKLLKPASQVSWYATKTNANVSVSATSIYSVDQANYPFSIDLMDENVLPVRVRIVNDSEDVIAVRSRSIKANVNATPLNSLTADNAVERFKFSPSGRYFALFR